MSIAVAPEYRVPKPSRPSLAMLGLNRVAITLLSVELVLIALSSVLYPLLGLSLVVQGVWQIFLIPMAPLLLWIYLAREPGRAPWDWAVADRMLALATFCILSMALPQFQYIGLAFKRPLIDEWLVWSDSMMRVNLVEWTGWSRQHVWFMRWLIVAYASFGQQLCLPLVALGIRNAKDRAALWEYLFHLTMCSTFTILVFALLPSNSSSTLYNFQPVFSQTTVVKHIAEMRSGQMTRIDFRILEGLVSFPSMHVAGAMIVTWTFRHKRWLLVPLFVVNVSLIASTLLLGIHYGIDLIAGALVFLGSLWAFRRGHYPTALQSVYAAPMASIGFRKQ